MKLFRDGTQVAFTSMYGYQEYGGGIGNKTWFSILDQNANTVEGVSVSYTVSYNPRSNHIGLMNWYSGGGFPSTSSVTLTEIAG